MEPPDRDRREETVDELREKLEDILRRSREQTELTKDMRRAVQAIHHRVLTGGFPILPRQEGNSK